MRSLSLILLALAVLPVASGSGSTEPAAAQAPPVCWMLDSPHASFMSAAGVSLLRERCESAAPVPPAPTLVGRGVVTKGVAGADVRLNDPAQDNWPIVTQNETTVATCDDTVIAGWNDSAGVFSGGFTGYAQSPDGGETWTDWGTPAGLTGGDPVLAAGPDCIFYFAAIAFLDSCPGIGVARSDDGGLTWSFPANASPGTSCANFQDKEWMAVDATDGANRGNVYACWDDRGPSAVRTLFSRSIDGGQTFQQTALIADAPFGFATGCQIAVAPDGQVVVAWSGAADLGMRVRASDDGGMTFGREVVVATTTMAGLFKLCSNNELRPVLNGDIRTANLPALAINPLNGHLHLAWNSRDAADPDIFYSRSPDGGSTWSPRIRLNDDSTSTDQFQPALAFSHSGILRAFWYDRRRDPGQNFMIDAFSTISVDDGATFSLNERITDVSFGVPPLDPNFDFGIATCYMGDYIGIAGAEDTHYMAWGDNRTITNGTPDPDVFFDSRGPTIHGDADCDGDADSDDGLVALYLAAEIPRAACTSVADADCDGEHTPLDALALFSHAAGTPPPPPLVPCPDIGSPLDTASLAR